MAEPDEDLGRSIAARLLRLNAAASGLAVGLTAGLALFVATNWLVIKGGAHVGQHLGLLSEFFIGYRVTFLGSLLGFAYAFGLGALTGYFVARVYNWLAGLREGSRTIR